MSRFLCDVEIARKTFKKFVTWYKERNPNFNGYIRQSARDLGVAEIIEGAVMKQYRFMCT